MTAGLSPGEPPGKDWTVERNAALVQGNYSGAVFYFDKAIQENRLGRATKIDPQISLAWNNKGIVLDKLVGRHGEAVRCYDKALEIDPKFVLAWTNKGYLLANMGRYDAALQSFDAATAHDLERITAWMGMVIALKILYIDDEAEAAQDKVEALGKASE
jgi:tetratricopeptide (TPR) repeat protein